MNLSLLLKTNTAVLRKVKWKFLSIPVLIEFIFANISDLLEPKFNVLLILFCFFGVILILCAYKIHRWFIDNKISLPVQTGQIFSKPNGLNDSIIKGAQLSIIGIIFCGVLLLIQFFTPNNNGALVNMFPGLQPLQEKLTGIESKLNTISEEVKTLKKEKSENPKKELQNLGLAWSTKNFHDQVKDGDLQNIKLFLEGKINPYTVDENGRTLPVVLALNTYNVEEVLELLLEYGVDINRRFSQSATSGDMKMTLLSRAIEKENIPLIKALLKHEADTREAFDTFGSFGLSIAKFPLQSAVYWKKKEVIQAMIEGGASIEAGEYAAYRELLQDQKNYYWEENRDAYNAFAAQLAPKGTLKEIIELEAELSILNAEISQKAIESIKSIGVSSRHDKIEQELKEKETRKKAIEAKLSKIKSSTQ